MAIDFGVETGFPQLVEEIEVVDVDFRASRRLLALEEVIDGGGGDGSLTDGRGQ